MLLVVAVWALLALPVALIWGRGRCRHAPRQVFPTARPAGGELVVHHVVQVVHEHHITHEHVYRGWIERRPAALDVPRMVVPVAREVGR
ncbi:hypothetical protein ACFQE5_18865 [Pseudonocardia hispaniensis]|uniref:Secreted protein n=1 Tax=Pseudonocardia hispaniensis TaxID=904933 RepID=A0ABW1J5X7_9PSEU